MKTQHSVSLFWASPWQATGRMLFNKSSFFLFLSLSQSFSVSASGGGGGGVYVHTHAGISAHT